jgi:hypothetical protein
MQKISKNNSKFFIVRHLRGKIAGFYKVQLKKLGNFTAQILQSSFGFYALAPMANSCLGRGLYFVRINSKKVGSIMVCLYTKALQKMDLSH